MLLLTILVTWLLLAFGVLALCTMARLGDLQSVDADADFDPVTGHDAGGVALLVKLDGGETGGLFDANKTQAA
jgi:hypothetical protein